ncbi:MAG: hypothetical protein ABI222_11870 [Opitutaceae bacterium]
MNQPRHLPLVLAVFTLLSAVTSAAAVSKRPAPQSDLAPIESRKAAVELANRLAKIETADAPPEAAGLQPFNPPGFGREARPASEPSAQVKVVSGDREILTALASKVLPKGTLSLGSERLLIFGKKNLRAGDRLTVNFEGQDYNLELVSFDRTNFTLRLNHEEITRPIKPGKNP